MILFKIFFKVVAALLALIVAIPTIATARVWWSGTHPAAGNAKYAIVLGAAQLNGRPGAVLTARLSQARALYKAGRVEKIITVGFSKPGDRTTEAKAGAAWLANNGVPRRDLIAVSQGVDTYTSTVAYAAKINDKKSARAFIVTDPWHCLRAVTMAKDLELNAECVPVEKGPNNLEKASSHYLLREMGAYLAYITLGRRGIHLSDHRSTE